MKMLMKMKMKVMMVMGKGKTAKNVVSTMNGKELVLGF